jgi:hypothetical protein
MRVFPMVIASCKYQPAAFARYMELLIIDTIDILKACIFTFASLNLNWFIASLVGGIVLGGLTWWVCSVFATLWNTKYSLTGWHHLLCALSAILVFCAVVLGSSMKYTQAVAEFILDNWGEQLKADEEWGHETFARCYDAVKKAGKENFAGHPDPRDGGNRIPINLPASQETVASVSVKSATDNFKTTHPVLSMILLADNEIPESVVLTDVKSYFGANPGGTYPHENAIRIAINHVKSGLEIQTPKVVFYSRLILGGLFAILFILTLLAISIGAYSDIKVHYVNA